ncbi:transketolase [Pelagibacterales bacterium SAG-MED44]|nr:transketolase [Pelagibacterales bacterium SAG-MED44]
MNLKINKDFDPITSLKRCNYYRKKIIDISQDVNALHAGGAFSSMEILDFIYFGLMKIKKKKILDTFILSKGHSSIAQYVILESLGILKKSDLKNYCTKEGILGAHPDYGNPGIEASTGSLGHGMGIATGISYANKINNSKSNTFIVISDGELQEGSTWETIMMAPNLKLNNLLCFIDHNGSQSFGETKKTHPNFYPISSKIKSFGWNCIEVDGHNPKKLSETIKSLSKKKPNMILCNTVKGKGVSFMENKPIWHYRSPNKKEYEIAIKELKGEDEK